MGGFNREHENKKVKKFKTTLSASHEEKDCCTLTSANKSNKFTFTNKSTISPGSLTYNKWQFTSNVSDTVAQTSVSSVNYSYLNQKIKLKKFVKL